MLDVVSFFFPAHAHSMHLAVAPDVTGIQLHILDTERVLQDLRQLFRYPGDPRGFKTEVMATILTPADNGGGLYLSGMRGATDFELLEAHRITKIVNLAGSSDMADFSADKTMYSSQVEYFKLNWHEDGGCNILTDLDTVTDFIYRQAPFNGNTLVHCQAGVNSSVVAVIAYLMRYHGHSLHQAVEWTVARRNYACPDDNSLIQLIEYARSLGKLGL